MNEPRYTPGQSVQFWDGVKLHQVTVYVVSVIGGKIYYTFEGPTIRGTSTDCNLWEVAA